jgi:phosphate transport system substrate-binding protein
VLQRAGGLTEAQAEAAVDFTKTAGAYERLRYGDVDLILVYEEAEPSAEEEEEDREVVPDGYTEDLELHPLGRDALVFLTSAENPIASLTVQQVKDIYTGKVTNWKEVGGTDAPIVAYQRDADSGSQALMEKLVMQGTPMAKAPQDLVETEMGGLVERIAGFVPGTDGQDGYALGYSVWYYAENMYADPNVKMIPIDGVYPDLAALSAGAYTLLNDFYAGIRKDAPEGGTARALLAWLLSDAGRACVADAGYAPVQ